MSLLAESFTAQSAAAAAAGGAVLGLVAGAKLRLNGDTPRIASPSPPARTASASLAAAGAVLRIAAPDCLGTALPAGPRLFLAGLLVGLGTARGGGCTSGHGICGNSRLSKRSLAATATFMAAGFAAATLSGTAAWAGAPPKTLAGAPKLALALAAAFVGAQAVAVAAAAGSLRRRLVDGLCAVTFGLALGVAGMTSPQRVAAFLDCSKRTFDPTLAFVMAGAIGVALPLGLSAWWPRGGAAKPALADAYALPPRSKPIDAALIQGAALFGAGWGIAGACPGPALVGLGAAGVAGALAPAALFNAAMVLGWAVVHRLQAAPNAKAQ
ncbi:hypothetical protein M885DRAFT_617012 [Pelagophyceae sp. CCMP2097]|nr:hypothetical protein M885DRAFT_617012 [Pelagophyceae sp. CCMP2097]